MKDKNIFNNKIFIYVNIVILFLLINGIAYSLNLKWDFSKGKINSISESTEKVLKKLKYPLLVEAYISRDIPGQLIAQLQPIIYLLEDIKRIGKDKINLKIINPVTEEERNLASKRGIQGIPIEEADIHKASVRMGYFGIYLQYGDKSTTISLVEQGGIVGNFEYVFLKELKKLLQDEKTISGIGYLKTKGSLDIRRWQTRLDQDKDNLFAFKNLLEKDMGQIKEIELKEPVPDTIETLIIAGLPELSIEEQYYLDQFLMKGGNLLLMLKGFDFTITPPNPQFLQLGISSGSRGFTTIPEAVKQWNQFLEFYGLKINERIVLEPNLAVPEVDILGQYLGRYPNPSWAIYSQETGNIYTNHELTKHIPYVIFPWFSDLSILKEKQPEVKYSILVQTSKKAILRKETSLSLKDLQLVGQVPLQEGDEETKESLPVMVLVQGKFKSAFKDKIDQLKLDKKIKEQFLPGQLGNTEGKILLIGTPYLVSDIFFRNEANIEYFKINYSFIQNILEYLQGDTDLIAVRSKVPFIPILQIQLPVELQKVFSWIHTLTIPLILSIYGFIRLRNRYRKRGVEQ
ncbi:MAG: gliding motility ABC transporter [Leptospiraceae bacterium]|nr:MAG: gliding motility ABC transporter [Leptospiraceae bacterium]